MLGFILFVFSSRAFAQIDTINITYPSGGETFTGGEQINITWESTAGIIAVSLEFSSNNGGNWTDIIINTENDGVHQWTVPNITSSECKIKIYEHSDTSDVGDISGTFSIDATSIKPLLHSLKKLNSYKGVEKIEVYDLQGRKVQVWRGNSTEINLNKNISNGIYIVRLVVKDVKKQFKIMFTK